MGIGFAVTKSIDVWPRSIYPQKALTTARTVGRGHVVTATVGSVVWTVQGDPAIANMKVAVSRQRLAQQYEAIYNMTRIFSTKFRPVSEYLNEILLDNIKVHA